MGDIDTSRRRRQGVQTGYGLKPPSRGRTRMRMPGVFPKGTGDPTLPPLHDAETPGAYEGGAPNNNEYRISVISPKRLVK